MPLPLNAVPATLCVKAKSNKPLKLPPSPTQFTVCTVVYLMSRDDKSYSTSVYFLSSCENHSKLSKHSFQIKYKSLSTHSHSIADSFVQKRTYLKCHIHQQNLQQLPFLSWSIKQMQCHCVYPPQACNSSPGNVKVLVCVKNYLKLFLLIWKTGLISEEQWKMKDWYKEREERNEEKARVMISSSHPQCNSSPLSLPAYANHNLSVTVSALLFSQTLPCGFSAVLTIWSRILLNILWYLDARLLWRH